MVYRDDDLTESAKELLTARDWAIWLMGSLLGAGLFISEYRRIMALAPDPSNYAYLGLMIVMAFLIFLWIWATKKELAILLKWLDPLDYAAPGTLRETGTILSLAVVLIGLLFASRNPLAFGIVFTIYNVITLFAYRYAARQIHEAIGKSQLRLQEDLASPMLRDRAQVFAEALEVLENYFVNRPQTRRHALITISTVVGVLLAILWQVQSINVCGLLAYIVFAAVIIVSELLIFLWRDHRDQRLRKLDRKYREMFRAARAMQQH